MQQVKKTRTKKIVLMGLFVALITCGAFIKIPIPYLPISMQNFFTMMCALLLGAKLGFLTVMIYIVMGLIGLPVFSMGGGLGYVLMPSFGYIIGFAIGAFFTGLIARKKDNPTFLRLFVACLVGVVIIYVIGIAYVQMINTYVLGQSIVGEVLFKSYFLTTLPGDIIKCLISAYLAKRLWKIVA